MRIRRNAATVVSKTLLSPDAESATMRIMVLHHEARCSPSSRIQVTSRPRITVNLGKAQHQELQALAKLHNVSMSWIAQVAIDRLLDQHRQNEFQFPLDLDPRTG